ncbi:MAG: hypothetical protein HYV27_10375 [Candidatus Hydrogenedentes bacterium]|nr:hypothetical protein [Candidatus Hydrogenedentota bacterium]
MDIEERIEHAAKLIDSGYPGQAMDILQALMALPEARPKACLYMGRCYHKRGSNDTARYLYLEAAKHPDCAVQAAAWMETCPPLAPETTEQTVCARCNLEYHRFSAECPYCLLPQMDTESAFSGEEEQAALDATTPEAGTSEPPSRESVIHAAGDALASKLSELSSEESLKQIKERAEALAREAKERARALQERDDVQELKKRATELKDETAERLRTLAHREEVQQFTEKVKASQNPFVREAHLFTERERRRFQEAPPEQRNRIQLRWIGMGLCALVLLAFALRIAFAILWGILGIVF